MVFANLFESAKKKKSEAAVAKPKEEAPKKEQSPSKNKQGSKNSKKTGGPKKNKGQKDGRKRDQHKPGDEEEPRKRRRKSDGPQRPAGNRVKPSHAVMALSAQLKDYSRQKRLDEAIALYWKKDAVVRDEHHACIVVDCCARCGSVQEAEKIVEELKKRVDKINVTTMTALLKGYAHSGRMQRAIEVFRDMCDEKELWDRPNVRTLNTLLRGCLWTAAVKDAETGQIAGGVVSSEEAWKLFKEKVGDDVLDSSSYETSITLLCQALRTREADERISEFQAKHAVRVKGKASLIGGDETVLETLAVNYLGLARAHALCGRSDDMWTACQRVLSAVKGAKALWSASQSQADGGKFKKHGTEGGKRAWKTNEGDDEKDSRRVASNIAYRTHRLSELETEAKDLIKMRGKRTACTSKDLARRVLQRLFYFSGGGTTDLAATGRGKEQKKPATQDAGVDFLTSSCMSFGISELVGDDVDTQGLDLAGVAELVGLSDVEAVWKDGRLDFDQLFSSKKKPVHIELGAGFGDWVVQQAQHDVSRNYVAVELRADRVFQIFSKSTLACSKPLENVAVVGSECGSFLRDRVRKGSISTVFANFPEPPTQSYGAGNGGDLKEIMNGGAEPAHMLNSMTLATAASCLESNGKIVIVTDNRWYARLLCATFVKVGRGYKGLRSAVPGAMKQSGLRETESFLDPNSKVKPPVILYEGLPGEGIVGHFKTSGSGDSYFDRLWRTGAGSHSERRTRFVIIMNRC